MGAAMFVSLGLVFLMGLPTLTYFYAKSQGRNPKLWFVIGFFLPGIATIILSFLPDKSENKETSSN